MPYDSYYTVVAVSVGVYYESRGAKSAVLYNDYDLATLGDQNKDSHKWVDIVQHSASARLGHENLPPPELLAYATVQPIIGDCLLTAPGHVEQLNLSVLYSTCSTQTASEF